MKSSRSSKLSTLFNIAERLNIIIPLNFVVCFGILTTRFRRIKRIVRGTHKDIVHIIIVMNFETVSLLFLRCRCGGGVSRSTYNAWISTRQLCDENLKINITLGIYLLWQNDNNTKQCARKIETRLRVRVLDSWLMIYHWRAARTHD